MNTKIVRGLVAFLLILITFNCIIANSLSGQSIQYSEGNDQGIPEISYYGNYNLIYGDWVVSEYLTEGKNCDEQQLKSYVNSTVQYRYNEIVVNGVTYSIKQYLPYVIAMDDRILFIGSDYYPSQEKKVFNIDSEYFAAFTPIVDGNSVSNLAVSLIIIKDNDTLILKTDVGYCILKRTGFLENLDTLVPPV